MTEPRAYRQLAAAVPNADTPAQMAALRTALVMMLHDEDYPEEEKEREAVTTALSQAGWSAETRQAMSVLALRWARGKDFTENLEKAIQRTGEEREAPRPAQPQRKESPMATVTSIPTTYNEAEGMAENLISDLDLLNELHRQADKMRIETDEGKYPFAVPPTKLVKALKYAETGHVTLREYDATVKGSQKEPYIVTTFGCTCEHGKRSPSRWGCHHTVAVELVQRATAALAEASGQAHLFAGPKTVDERLAETPQDGPGDTITMENDGWREEEPETPLEAPRGAEEGSVSPTVVEDTPVIPETVSALVETWREGTLASEPVFVAQDRIERSAQIDKLMIALARAQQRMHNPALDMSNPHFKSKYTSLAAVRDAITPCLTAESIALTQLVSTEGNAVLCTTGLWHASGQYLCSTLRLPVGKQDAQGYGAAITYARRYALMGVCNVAGDEDDDGESLRGKETGQRGPDMTGRQTTAPIPLDEIKALLAQLGYAEPTPKLVRELTGQELAPQHYAVILSKLKSLVAERN